MKSRGEIYKGLGGYGTLGMEIVLSFLIGVFGGHWLDDRYGTSPWLFLGGVLLGGALSVKAVLRAVKQMRQVAEEEEREQGNPKPLYESTSERAERKKRGEEVGDPVVDRIPVPGETPTTVSKHDSKRDSKPDSKDDEEEGAS